LLVAWSTAARSSSQHASELCGQAGGIASELAVISGLKLRRPVPCDLISKEKVNEFLKKRVKEATTPEEIRAEELTLKKFGFAPRVQTRADHDRPAHRTGRRVLRLRQEKTFCNGDGVAGNRIAGIGT